MATLLPCPICGNQPKLSSLEPERQSMKYFCGVHVSSGNWKENEELATTEWNKRVQEYEDWSRQVKIPGTPEFMYAQAILKAHAYCEDCDYETDNMSMKDLLFKLCMEGGYIVSDKGGGYFSQCPKCESENLSLVSN